MADELAHTIPHEADSGLVADRSPLGQHRAAIDAIDDEMLKLVNEIAGGVKDF